MGDKQNKTLGKNSNCFFYVEEDAIIVSSLWLLRDSFCPPACSVSALMLPPFQWLLERSLGCWGVDCEAQLFKAERLSMAFLPAFSSSTHLRHLTTTCTSSSRGSIPSSGLHTQVHTATHRCLPE